MDDELEKNEPVENSRKLADAAIDAACNMLIDGARGRMTRFDEIKRNEDMYFNVPKPALKGRSNIPFDSVVMGGYVDTALSILRERVSIVYSPNREQDKMAAEKLTAAARREIAPERGAWDAKITNGKLMALLSGINFQKLTFEQMPFKPCLEVIDHYDMIIDPRGGPDIDKLEYKFQMNIFKTREELLAGVKSGKYDRDNVREFLNTARDPEKIKKFQDIYQSKDIRYATFGVNVEGKTGEQLYRLVEGVFRYQGKWYYSLFSFETKKAIRFAENKEVFGYAEENPGRGPWTMWHTHPHPLLSWGVKAPASDVAPIAYTMKKIVNYTIDNLEKRNWNMSAYDPKMFTNPADLAWKQDGLVRATLKPNQDISRGIFSFETPDTTTITINMVQWLDNFLGTKTGITPGAQGQAQEERVGILVSNMERVSKRMQLTNSHYRQALTSLATMLDWGFYEYLREPYAVKLIGPKGAQWEEEITRRDTERDFSTTVRDENEEEERNAIDLKKRELGFQKFSADPSLRAGVNQKWYQTQILKDMGFDDEQITVALDINNDGDENSRAEAAQAIADCLDGKELYRMYRNATPGFIQKILDFCSDEFPLYPPEAIAQMSKGQLAYYQKQLEKHDKLIAYANAHVPIAMKNMARKAVSLIAQNAVPNAQNGTQVQSNQAPASQPAPVA